MGCWGIFEFLAKEGSKGTTGIRMVLVGIKLVEFKLGTSEAPASPLVP